MIYEAMGAKAIDKKDPRYAEKIEALFDNANYIGQRKLNGERILSFIPDQEEIKLYGRGFSKYGGRIEKTALLPHLVEELRQRIPQGTVLDGEVLYIPDWDNIPRIKSLDFKEDFWKGREIMGSHPSKAIQQQESEGRLHYFVFDILVHSGQEMVCGPFGDRQDVLQVAYKRIFDICTYIHFLPVVHGTTAKRDLFQHALDLGLEGIILKSLSKPYVPGKKPTNSWVKVKQKDSADCVVMGYSPANRWTEITRDGKKVLGPDGKPVIEESKYYRMGWIGAIWVGQFIPSAQVTKEQQRVWGYLKEDGHIFAHAFFGEETQTAYSLAPVAKVSGIDESLRSFISEHKEAFLGRIMQISYFEKTDESYFQPRFEGFREDKSIEECVW